MPLKIWYPFKPFVITQHWGNPSTAYSTQFNDPTFKRHNGTDARPSKNDQYTSYNPTKYPVFCPVEGFKVFLVQYAPNGGGHEIWLISKDKVQIGDKLCYAYLVMCHGDKILVQPGYEPALGEMIMIADNTGFSTGVHTHIGLYRVDFDGVWFTKLDENDSTGSYNPEDFFTGIYAADVATLGTLMKGNWRYYQYLLTS